MFVIDEKGISLLQMIYITVLSLGEEDTRKIDTINSF